MFPAQCSAVLKSMKNTVLEVGTACVSLQEKYVDFLSDFVPLIQIKTIVKLVCVEEGLSTHLITGEVFLSSPRMLRIVNIHCTLLTNAETVLSAQNPFPAKIQVPILSGRFLKGSLIQRWQPCTVLSISLKSVILRCNRIPEEYEESIKIKIDVPIFDTPVELSLRIGEKGILFGKQAKYHYIIGGMSRQTYSLLAEYIRETNILALGDTV